jgi:hypothetical protein
VRGRRPRLLETILPAGGLLNQEHDQLRQEAKIGKRRPQLGKDAPLVVVGPTLRHELPQRLVPHAHLVHAPAVR